MEPLKILFQDADFIAVDKPSGIMVHRSRESSDEEFLLQKLRDQVGRHVFPIHRLDRGVSGVLMFALSSESAALMQSSLQEKDSIKNYLAFVRGISPEEGEIDKPLTSDSGKLQEAVTSFRRLGVLWNCSLLQVEIKTGRRHQIRRHLSSIKHQIIGDTRYGKGRYNRYCREHFGLNRIFLHASRLEFIHPKTKTPTQIEAPLPAELLNFLVMLPGYDPSIFQLTEP